MRISVKAAVIAAMFVASAAPLAGLIGVSAVTASDVPDQIDTLVPQSVMTAALAEERAVPDSLYLPNLPERRAAEPAQADATGSLADLVARHASTQTDGREHDCLAKAVYFEAKGESLVGQLAVAEVIANRAASGRFPASICGVVTQPGQFSFVRGGNIPGVVQTSQHWRQAVGIATIAQRSLKQSGVGDALFFHARYVSPGWRLRRVAAVGNHIFYR